MERIWSSWLQVESFRRMALLGSFFLLQIFAPMLPFYGPNAETNCQSQGKVNMQMIVDGKQIQTLPDSNLLDL